MRKIIKNCKSVLVRHVTSSLLLLASFVPGLVWPLAQVALAQQTQKITPESLRLGKSASAPQVDVVPIDLNTLLRLARRHSPQVAVASVRVQEASKERQLADGKCLSGLPISPTFYRKVQADSKVFLQQGELSKITTESVVEAGETYFDFLAAKTGAAFARDQEKILESLLADAQRLASTEGAARVEVVRIEAELASRRQTIAKLQAQSAGATAKLRFLLGLNPAAKIQPLEKGIVPVELVNANPPTLELVAQALAQGPGIREMEELLALVQERADRAKPILILSFGLQANEGTGGTVLEDSLTWDDRHEGSLKVGSKLSELFTQNQKRRLLQAKLEEAHLAYQELQGRLILGVDVAREAINSGREQIHQGEEQIVKARRAYELSNERLKLLVAGSSYSEVLLSLQSLGLAQINYLNAIREYDKAQVRLFVLLGGEKT